MYKRTAHPSTRDPLKTTSPARRGAPLLFSALAVCLSACQSYEERPLDSAAHIEAWSTRDLDNSSLEESLEFAQTSLPISSAGFDSTDGLTLHEGRLAALAYNPRLRIARLEVERALASAAHSGLWEDPEYSLETLKESGAGHDSRGSLSTLTFSIPVFGRTGAQQAKAGAELHATRLKNHATEWDIWHELSREWVEWSAIKARQVQTVKTLQAIDDLVGRTALLAQAGELLPTEAGLFVIEKAQLQSQITTLDASARMKERILLALMGLPPGAERQLIPSLDGPLHGPIRDILSALSTQNPRLAQLSAEYELAEATLRHEVNKQRPDITLGPAFETDSGQSRIGLLGGLPIPLLNANKRAIEEARSAREVARDRVEAEHESLLGRASAAASHVMDLVSLRRDLEQTLAPLLDRQVADASRLHQLGEGDILVLLESLTRSHQTRLDAIDARAEEALSRHLLSHILGPIPLQAQTEESQ